jgi:hypothetical protein
MQINNKYAKRDKLSLCNSQVDGMTKSDKDEILLENSFLTVQHNKLLSIDHQNLIQ